MARELGQLGEQALVRTLAREVSLRSMLGALVPPYGRQLVDQMIAILEREDSDLSLSSVHERLILPWDNEITRITRQAFHHARGLTEGMPKMVGMLLLSALAPHLPEPALWTAWSEALEIDDVWISTLESFVVESKRRSLVRSARLSELLARSLMRVDSALSDLISNNERRLKHGEGPSDISRAEQSVINSFWVKSHGEEEIASMMESIARQLDEDLLERALVTAGRISDVRIRARAIAALAPLLAPSRLDSVVADALATTDRHAKAKIIAAITPVASPELRRTLFDVANQFPMGHPRAVALGAFLASDEDVVCLVRYDTLWTARTLEGFSRSDVLRFCREGLQYDDERVWSPQLRAELADTVIDVCFDWKW